MNRSAFVALGLAGALALAAAPASAQHHRNGGEGERHDRATPRGDSRQDSRPAPAAQPSQPQASRPAPRQEQRVAPRQEQRAVPRAEIRSAPRTYAPRYESRYEPRYSAQRSYSGSYSGRYYGPRYSGPRFSIAPRRLYRPYYVFHPRLSIGFGLWAGYPVSYYDPYYYPYEYSAYSAYPPYATAQPYALPPSGVNVQPGPANMGGLSFEITPETAEVFIDGNYVGTVGQFTPSSQPLGLTPGRHHVEIREPGYEVSAFDVDIIAGQVVPYSGTLEQ